MQKMALALLAAGVSTDTRFRFVRESDGSFVTYAKCGGLATHFVVDPSSSRNRKRADAPRTFSVTTRPRAA
jgi:hypothetical protein